MNATTSTLPPIQTAAYFAHGRAIIEALHYLADHTRLLDETMLDLRDGGENIPDQIEFAAQALGHYLARLLTLDGGNDQDYRREIAERADGAPGLAALAEIKAIIDRENARKPVDGWKLEL